MFKVQRFTCEDEEHSVDNNDTNSTNSHARDDILNSLVQRAKSRVKKRARVEDTTSGDAADNDNNASTSLSTRVTGHDPNLGRKDSGTAAAAVSIAASAATVEGGTFRKKSVRSSGQQGLKDNHAGAVDGAAGVFGIEEDGGQDSKEESEDEMEDTDKAGEKDRDMQGRRGASSGQDGVASDAGATCEEGEGLRPMEEVADEWGLDARLSETLREEGVKHFFPIQVHRSFVVSHDTVLLCDAMVCSQYRLISAIGCLECMAPRGKLLVVPVCCLKYALWTPRLRTSKTYGLVYTFVFVRL